MHFSKKVFGQTRWNFLITFVGFIASMGFLSFVARAEQAQRGFDFGKMRELEFRKGDFLCNVRNVSDWNFVNDGLFNRHGFHDGNVLDDFIRPWYFHCLDDRNFLDDFNFSDDLDGHFDMFNNFNNLHNFLDNGNVLDNFDFLNNFDC